MMKRARRKRFAWANKVDPETGVPKRFCTQCEAFLPVERFYPSVLKTGRLCCKTHFYEITRPYSLVANRKLRGKPGSVARMRTNVNVWISRNKHKSPGCAWTDADVEQALLLHNVDRVSEQRTVRFRPRDPELPFTAANSVVRFRATGGSGSKKPHK